MKTLKTLKIESVKFYTEDAEIYFAHHFSKKMGGTQTITFENNFLPQINIDKREYYTGRGAKYNTNSMHEHIDIFVTKKEFDRVVNNRAKSLFEDLKESKELKKKLNKFCTQNNLNYKNYTEISSDLCIYFEESAKNAIEKELQIDLTDFFNASGKTYFFAESKLGLLRFFHNHRQSYSFEFSNQKINEQRDDFFANRKSWVSARFAHLLGQNDNVNLFVC